MTAYDFSTLLELQQKCIAQCRLLLAYLQQERQLTIEFNSEGLLENASQKELVLEQLVTVREKYFKLKQQIFNDSYEPDSKSALYISWKEGQKEYEVVWNELRSLGEQNRAFLKHSLRNLDFLSEHLKRLLGILSTYSSAGTKRENQPSGTVIQGSY